MLNKTGNKTRLIRRISIFTMSDIKKLYEKNFDSEAYVEFYVSENTEAGWLVEDFYHRIFTQDQVRGQTLLDVGSGPTVRVAISASAFVPEIYLSDLLERNRNLVTKWIHNEADAVDFSAQFKHVADLEGIEDYRELEKRARNAIKEILPCDVLADNPIHPCTQQFDIVTSSFCVDCYPDDKDYFQGVKNLSNLARPGGRLALISSYKCSTYAAGEISLPGNYVDEVKLRKAMNEANLDVVEIYVQNLPKVEVKRSDCDGMLFALAVKRL